MWLKTCLIAIVLIKPRYIPKIIGIARRRRMSAANKRAIPMILGLHLKTEVYHSGNKLLKSSVKLTSGFSIIRPNSVSPSNNTKVGV
jgi:hypothetical protein